MTKKTNSNLLRISYKKNNWNSKFIEKKKHELARLIFNNFEITTFIYKFFKKYKLLVALCEIEQSVIDIKIFISYYITLKSIYLINQINKRQNIIIERKKKVFFRYRKKKLIFFKARFWLAKKKKKTNFFKKKTFIEKLIESLNIFTNNKLYIKVILQNINKGLSFRIKNKDRIFYKKTLIKLRKYSKAIFFRDGINILSILTRKKKTSKIFSEFIAFQLSITKRHNYFLNFLRQAIILLKNSKFSYFNGIKIVINGRLNRKSRSKNFIIQVGTVSIQTFAIPIDYSQSVSFTLYGTFGIKVWICEK